MRLYLDPHAFVVARTAGMPTPPLTRRAALIASVLVAVSLIVAFAVLWGTASQSVLVMRFWDALDYIEPLLALFLNLVPFTLTITAALLASQHTRSEHYRLLMLTELSGKALYQGLWLAALYRMRALLILTLVAVPLLAGLRVAPHVMARFTSGTPHTHLVMLVIELMTVFAGVRLIGVALLAAAIGVMSGIDRLEVTPVIVAVSMLAIYYVVNLIVSASLSVLAVALIGMGLEGSWQLLDAASVVVAMLALTLAPYLLLINELRTRRLMPRNASGPLPSAQG